jgi:PD-(D/E)XK nuclease superfamily
MAAVATANADLPLGGCSFQIGSTEPVEIPGELALRDGTYQSALLAPAPASQNCLIALERAPKAELGKLLSPTQVRAFLNCSARWWFKYGLSEPEPKNSALALGSAVHRALEANFREKVTTKEDLDTLGVVALFRMAWQEQADQTEFRDDEDPAALGKVGEQLVAKYMDEAAPWIQPAAVELDVAGEIGGVRVRGKIDLLDEDGRVVDVKTAARKPFGIAPDYAFQLATYRQITPGASGEARLDTLVKTKTVQLIQQGYTVGEQDLRATEVLYPLVQEGIANGLYFPNRQSLTCSRRNCAFWRQCEREFGGTIAAS